VICASGAFAQGCVSVLSFKQVSETASKVGVGLCVYVYVRVCTYTHVCVHMYVEF